MPLDLRMASKGMAASSEEKGAPMSEPNYRIVHIVDVPAPAMLEAQRLGFGWCSSKRRSGCALHWTCGVKPKPKGVNKPLHHFIVHGLDKPGSSATVSSYASPNSVATSITHAPPPLHFPPQRRSAMTSLVVTMLAPAVSTRTVTLAAIVYRLR